MVNKLLENQHKTPDQRIKILKSFPILLSMFKLRENSKVDRLILKYDFICHTQHH